MYQNPPPNKEEFEKVCKELENEPLNLRLVGRVFGQAFWEILVLTLCDAKEATAVLAEMREKK